MYMIIPLGYRLHTLVLQPYITAKMELLLWHNVCYIVGIS